MKTLIILLISFLTILNCVDGQQIKYGMGAGFADVETYNQKNIFVNLATTLGAEFEIRKNWKFMANIEYNILLGNEIDLTTSSNSYKTIRSILLPIAVRPYAPISKTCTAYFELGVYPGWNFSRMDEVYINTVKTHLKKTNLGYFVGRHAGFGIKKQFGAKWYFDIGITDQRDFWCSFKNAPDKIKTNRSALNVSLGKIFAK